MQKRTSVAMQLREGTLFLLREAAARVRRAPPICVGLIQAQQLSNLAPMIVVVDFWKGMHDVTKAAVRLPIRMFWAGALGMQNAPKRYGDKTVRPSAYCMTGFRSGCKLAGSELYGGFYDGVVSLVRLLQLEMEKKRQEGFSSWCRQKYEWFCRQTPGWDTGPGGLPRKRVLCQQEGALSRYAEGRALDTEGAQVAGRQGDAGFGGGAA